MKFFLSTILVITLAVTTKVFAFPGQPGGSGGNKVCRHVDSQGNSESIFAIIPMNQQCPSYSHTKTVNGKTYTFIHTGANIEISPKMQDPYSPTCFNEEVLLPSD